MQVLSGRYRLERCIGVGGMSVVWQAQDTVLGRPVAVKLLGRSLTTDGAAHARVRAEARAAARLAHPNVASVYDFGRSWVGPLRRVSYIVMELLDGDTLAAHLLRGPLPWPEAVGVCAEVAPAPLPEAATGPTGGCLVATGCVQGRPTTGSRRPSRSRTPQPVRCAAGR